MEQFIKDTNKLYSITSNGLVYSYRYKKKKLLKQQTNSSGYKQVGLVYPFGVRLKLVHRLVAEAFLENYSEKLSVHHIDYNPNNNDVSNLQSISYADNVRDAARNLHMNKKLTQQNVIEIKTKLHDGGWSQASLAREYNVSGATISYIKSGKFWKHTEP